MFSFDPYSWLLNFGINTAMGKDPMTSAKNATIGQVGGNLLGNIVPADLFPTEVAGNTVTQASQNLPQAMISQDTLNQGILNQMGDAASIGGANLMSAAPLNTAQSLMPSYMDTSGKLLSQGIGTQTIPSMPTQAQIAPSSLYTSGVAPIETTGYAPEYMRTEQFVKDPTQVSTPLQTARTDIPQQQDFSQRPDFGIVTKSTPEEIASRTGGYEEEPLYKTAYNKVANYIEENPLEAGMYGLIGGSAIYSGLNPRQQRVPLTQVTSSVKQATAPQFGSPLKIRRPGMRG